MSDPFPTAARAIRAGSRRQLVRVVGILTEPQLAERRFLLTLDDGVLVPCVLVAGDPEVLTALVGRRASVSGTGVWDLPGALLRIEADRVEEGAGASSFWSRTPPMPQAVSELAPEAMTLMFGYAWLIDFWNSGRRYALYASQPAGRPESQSSLPISTYARSKGAGWPSASPPLGSSSSTRRRTPRRSS